MKHILCIIIVIMLLIGLPVRCMAQLLYPLGGNPFTFDYERIARAGIDGQRLEYLSPTGPYATGIMQDTESAYTSPILRMVDARFDRQQDAAADPMALGTVAGQRYRTARGVRGDDLPFLTGGLSYLPGSHFGATVFFNLDRARAVDPDYTGKIYRGLAGGIETAVLTFQKGKAALTLGRQRMFWGPQRINLLISESTSTDLMRRWNLSSITKLPLLSLGALSNIPPIDASIKKLVAYRLKSGSPASSSPLVALRTISMNSSHLLASSLLTSCAIS